MILSITGLLASASYDPASLSHDATLFLMILYCLSMKLLIATLMRVTARLLSVFIEVLLRITCMRLSYITPAALL